MNNTEISIHFSNNYLGDYITAQNFDSIPYLVQGPDMYLITGEKCVQVKRIPHHDYEYLLSNLTIDFRRNRTRDEWLFARDYLKLKSMKQYKSIREYQLLSQKDFPIQILNQFKEQLINDLKNKNLEKSKTKSKQDIDNYSKEQAEKRQTRLIEDYDYNKQIRQINQQKRKELDKLDKEHQPELFKQHQEQLKPTKSQTTGTQTKESFKFDKNAYPYRSLNKLKSLFTDFDNEKYKQIKHYNNFDIKQSKKEYSLRTCSKVKYTFIGDIFFDSNHKKGKERKLTAFLLLIDVNTRYAYAYQLGEIDLKEITNVDENNEEYEVILADKDLKTTTELIKAFNKHLKVSPVNILRFDGERAINSPGFQEYLKQHNIKFIESKTQAHTSLSLIDRLCRTIRDIAFNLNIYAIVSQIQMNKILNYYNNARHETLTKIIFKSHPEMKEKYTVISPNLMKNHEELEKIFVEECLKYNFSIVSNPDYKLNISDVVKVTSEKNKLGKKRTILNKDDYKVIEQQGNIFKLKNVRTNEITYKPRFEILK